MNEAGTKWNPWAVVAAAAGCAACGAGASAADLRSLLDTPLAIRGGVMLLPLVGGTEMRLPEHVDLVLADGQRIQAMVAWIEAGNHGGQGGQGGHAGSASGDTLHAHWTASPSLPRISPSRPAGHAQPILLARVPADAEGEIRLGNQRLRPMWIDRAQPADAGLQAAPLRRIPAPDRPCARSPFDHWRWVLLADRFVAAPPPLDTFTDVEALLAEHTADLWRFGLSRLGEHNISLALDVRDRLTRICTDATGEQRTSFAAWIVDPGETNRLLGTLADVRLSPADAAAEARTWLDTQAAGGATGGLLTWVESATDERVRLAVVNTAHRPVVARFTWATAGGPAGLPEEPPIAVELLPGRLTQVALDHPQARQFPWTARVATRGGSLHLRITSDLGTTEIPFGQPGRGVTVVRAPGLVLPPLRPPLTLSDVVGGQPIMPDHAAVAQLRKLRGRWELFFEVMRPAGGPAGDGAPRASSEDSISVLIGPEEEDGGPNVHLVVPERDWHELRRGDNDGTLQVHRRSYEDRWYCRIVLPDAWLNTLPGEVTLIGVMRTPADRSVAQYSPFAPVPWRPASSRIAVDLSEWDDLPH